MARTPRIPKYRFHKGSGQAVVVLAGKSVYLGGWNTPESRVEYERVLAEWLAAGRLRPAKDPAVASEPAQAPTVNEILLAFWDHESKHYRHADGKPTKELDNLRDSVKFLRRLYGRTPAQDFGPSRLRAVREEMIRSRLCRRVVNDRVKRLRRVFRWAVSMELIPPSVLQSLETVTALQRGRCDARESPGVQPVEWAAVERVLPHLPRQVAAMVQLMRYSNCRAEDAVILRGADLIMSSENVWQYRPAHHKNLWREETSSVHQRIVHLGPQCQEIIRPFLKLDPSDYLFSPREAREELRASRRATRKSKPTPSEGRRVRKARPKRVAGTRYTVNTFQQTVRRTCRKLGLPVWTLLQVRHARATDVREKFGLEGAAASLGDTVEAAQIYAARNRQLAERIAREIG